MTPAAFSPPVPGKPRAYHFPRAERHVLAGGTRVVIAPLPRVPLVTFTAIFHRAGAEHDPGGHEGLAQLTAAMLLEGTAARDGAGLAEYFEGLGSSLGASADWDATLVGFTVQPARLSGAVRALSDLLRAPAFPDRQLGRMRAEQRASRMQLIAEPRSLANAAFAWACYDGHSRYRRSVDGTMATVDAVTRDDIVAFWRTQYAPGALTVVITGDVAPDHALAAAHTLVDGWTVATPAPEPAHAAARYASAGITLVEKPGAAQTELRVGHISVPRVNDAFFPLTVMNAILGGLFSSRINLNLRERHGYTYGASSGFDWRTGAGPWAVSTAVNTEVSGAATSEILSEIQRMRESAVTADELELASNYLVGVFPLRFETTTAVASALASQVIFGLPDTYFDSYRERIAAVTPADIQRVAAEYLHPDRLQIVAVGDPPALRTQLGALNFGAMHVTSPETTETAL